MTPVARQSFVRAVVGVFVSIMGMTLTGLAVVALDSAVTKASAEPAVATTRMVIAPSTPPPKPRAQKKSRKPARQAATAGPAAPSVGTSIGLAEGLAATDDDFGTSEFADDNLAAAGDVVMTENTVDDPPRPLKQVAPVHPPHARKRGITGEVTLSLVIDDTGVVREPKVLRATPPDVFETAALDAVVQWRFQPARYKGAPVQVRRTLTIAFTLGE